MEEMFLQKRISLLFSDFSGNSFRALSVDLRLKSLKKKSFCFLNFDSFVSESMLFSIGMTDCVKCL